MKVAAIFSNDIDAIRCNMMEIFERVMSVMTAVQSHTIRQRRNVPNYDREWSCYWLLSHLPCLFGGNVPEMFWRDNGS